MQMNILPKNALIIYLLFLVLYGCKVDDDGDDQGNGDNNNNNGNSQLDLEISSTTNTRGIASISFNTASDVTKMSISAQSAQGKDIRITNLLTSHPSPCTH